MELHRCSLFRDRVFIVIRNSKRNFPRAFTVFELCENTFLNTLASRRLILSFKLFNYAMKRKKNCFHASVFFSHFFFKAMLNCKEVSFDDPKIAKNSPTFYRRNFINQVEKTFYVNSTSPC